MSDAGVVEAVRDLMQEYEVTAQLLRDLGPGIYESLLWRVRRGQTVSAESYLALDVAITALRAKRASAPESGRHAFRLHVDRGVRILR